MDELELWYLKWGVETSARYHDWRRSRLWTIVRFIKMITLTKCSDALVTAFNPLHLDSGWHPQSLAYFPF